jgi:hypothetical protein
MGILEQTLVRISLLITLSMLGQEFPHPRVGHYFGSSNALPEMVVKYPVGLVSLLAREAHSPPHIVAVH